MPQGVVVRKEVFLLVRSEHLTLLKPHKYTPLQASLDAFLFSMQAARCTAKRLVHYRYTVGPFEDTETQFLAKRRNEEDGTGSWLWPTANRLYPDAIGEPRRLAEAHSATSGCL